ncbi:hypothetical protein FJR04_11920 [Anabaena sp. UHCC 0204]|nr:hypothetical protein [Anabaena sp. UHCC 0204]
MRYSYPIANSVGAQGLRPQLYCILPITAIKPILAFAVGEIEDSVNYLKSHHIEVEDIRIDEITINLNSEF